METWSIVVVMGVARSKQNFNLEPIRHVDEWLWRLGGEANVAQMWNWNN